MPVIPGYGTSGYQNIGNNILSLKQAYAQNQVARQELKDRQRARMLQSLMDTGRGLQENARYKEQMDYRKNQDAVRAHDQMRDERRSDERNAYQRTQEQAQNARADAAMKIQQMYADANMQDRSAKRTQEMMGSGMDLLRRLPGIGNMLKNPQERMAEEQFNWKRMMDVQGANRDAREMDLKYAPKPEGAGSKLDILKLLPDLYKSDPQMASIKAQLDALDSSSATPERINALNDMMLARQKAIQEDAMSAIGGTEADPMSARLQELSSGAIGQPTPESTAPSPEDRAVNIAAMIQENPAQYGGVVAGFLAMAEELNGKDDEAADILRQFAEAEMREAKERKRLRPTPQAFDLMSTLRK